jgi:hypothetical protein
MDESFHSYRSLQLLGRAFRERQGGVLSLGEGEDALALVLRDGQIVGVVFPEGAPARALPPPGPDDSAQVRLERVLSEIGIRGAPRPARKAQRNLRERMLAGLLDPGAGPGFAEGALAPDATVEVAGATEQLLLEAVRRIPDPEAVRALLGDPDGLLRATAGLAEERTLTLTEGYLLSRIDGATSARQVLQRIPLDPDDVERTLLGLLLTGRVECRAPTRPHVAAGPELAADGGLDAALSSGAVDETVAAAPASAAPLAAEPGAERSEAEEEKEPAAPAVEEGPRDEPSVEVAPPAEYSLPAAAVEPAPADTPAPAKPDPADLERRREVLEFFQSLPLRNHFEVLGVRPGCEDAEVKRAYAALARKYHPDTSGRPGLEDLHDVLEAVFIRVAEAWEVLGNARSRASYEARFPPSAFRAGAAGGGATLPAAPAARPAAAPPEPEPYVASDETLFQAQLLLTQARYWDAIQMLETRLPAMQPAKQQRRARILLARAYAKNPNWLRKAEDALQQVVREDPTSADAHYELGLLYKASGMIARAQASFRRVLELRPEHREAAAELGAAPSPSGGLLKRIFGRGKAS